MKVFTFILAAITLCCPKISLLANDDLVKIHYQGTDLLAKQLVKGHFNLYVSNQFEKKRVTGPLYRKKKTVFVKRYFLKLGEKVEKITPYNYKRVLKKYLPNAPDLHQRLGKPGFRYANIPSIIRYYNTFKVPGIEVEDGSGVPAMEMEMKKD